MPVTIIEALASARPVVATDVGAVRSLIVHGETGLLVQPRNSDEVASAIVSQIRDKAIASQMGLKGRAHVHPMLSIERLQVDLRGMYRDLVGEKLGFAQRSGVRSSVR